MFSIWSVWTSCLTEGRILSVLANLVGHKNRDGLYIFCSTSFKLLDKGCSSFYSQPFPPPKDGWDLNPWIFCWDPLKNEIWGLLFITVKPVVRLRATLQYCHAMLVFWLAVCSEQVAIQISICCLSKRFFILEYCELTAMASNITSVSKREKVISLWSSGYRNKEICSRLHPPFTSTATDEDHEAASWKLSSQLARGKPPIKIPTLPDNIAKWRANEQPVSL